MLPVDARGTVATVPPAGLALVSARDVLPEKLCWGPVCFLCLGPFASRQAKEVSAELGAGSGPRTRGTWSYLTCSPQRTVRQGAPRVATDRKGVGAQQQQLDFCFFRVSG